MKPYIIPISGTIGYEVLPSSIRESLAAADGKPVEIQISSAGGLVLEGLEIFNLIKNYEGKKTCHLMGLAASMASYISLAGDRITAEANCVFMVHNVLGVAVGNHDDLRKAADIYEGFTNLLATAYAAKCGKTVADVRAMMDAETFLFGAEAKDAGFVDEILGDGSAHTAAAKHSAIANARAACLVRAEAVKNAANQRDSLPRLAACLKPPAAPTDPALVAMARKAGVTLEQVAKANPPGKSSERVIEGAKRHGLHI